MGIIVIADAPYFDMEHINGRLSEELLKDSTYRFEFYVRIAKNLSNYFSSCIGIHFSDKPILTSEVLPDNYLQAIKPEYSSAATSLDPTNPCDTTWTRVYGSYRARGGERFICIGMFWQDHPKLVAYIDHVHKEQFKRSAMQKGKKLFRDLCLRKNPYRTTDVGSLGQSHAYYFIDDVLVVPDY